MTVYFTADTHFGHEVIRRHCRRLFASADEMNEVMIERWNAAVGLRDDVWHLGDFAHGASETAAVILKRLRGRKHLVHGNHDRHGVRILPGWASSSPFVEIKADGTRISLMHYAMRTWPGSHHGALHFFGHSHGAMPGDRQSLDVGVDVWDFRPVALAEIRARLAGLSERRRRCNPATA